MKQLYTRWGRDVDPEHVLEEYPRPLMKREKFMNLNGWWDYRITRSRSMERPGVYDGKILVPFSPESALSGVKRPVKPGETLWYRRSFQHPAASGRDRILLHFGAVDQMCIVYVNQKRAGSHKGGYLPFDLDITRFLKEGENELCVQVRDVSDTSYHARGKQKLKRGGMFYTAQSGIWQTVWMETVPEDYIRELRCRPDYDKKEVEITVLSDAKMDVAVDLEGKLFAGMTNIPIRIPLERMESWTPEHPYLYLYTVVAGKDRVESYFAMRCFTVEKDRRAIPRLCLNHRPYFQKGILDQGYWPDGLYTAPSDEAMIFDITAMKEEGYCMIRKHCKIEPQRWYYHCDRLGMIVWQDMVNGGSAYHHWFVMYAATVFGLLHIRVTDRMKMWLSRKSPEGRKEFEKEIKSTIKVLYNHPSIAVWTLFNEGWGQFDTARLEQKMRALDPTRLIDAASGWFDQGTGDFQSTHNYFFRLGVKPEKERACILSEFGGFSMRVKGHCSTMQMYGYRIFADKKKFRRAYRNIWQEVAELEKDGLCAAVYTQLSDVEDEVNGILTYDREVRKTRLQKRKEQIR
ncbi:glycoside hydrolase family 2 [Drancourtella sp. An177]|nr:glycoside hydrolase family 2 [Drancourtella sp. An177]